LLIKRKLARGNEQGNLVAQRITDAGDGIKLAGGDDVGQVTFELTDGPRCLGVSQAAKAIFTLQFEEIGDFVEDGGDFVLVHFCQLSVVRGQLSVVCRKKSPQAKYPAGIIIHWSTNNGPRTTDN